jgi:hypothetical protein
MIHDPRFRIHDKDIRILEDQRADYQGNRIPGRKELGISNFEMRKTT